MDPKAGSSILVDYKTALTRQLLQAPVLLNQFEDAGAGFPQFSTTACHLQEA